MKYVKKRKSRVSKIYIPEILESKPTAPNNDVNSLEYQKYLEDLKSYNDAFERWQENQEYEEDDILESDFRRQEKIVKNKFR